MGFRNPLIPEKVTEAVHEADGIPAGDIVDQTITAPHGWLWELRGLLMVARASTSASPSTGNHDLRANLQSGLSALMDIGVLTATASFGDALEYAYGEWRSTTTSAPSDPAAQARALEAVVLDSERELRIRYHNNTDAAGYWRFSALFAARRIEEAR